MEKHKPWIQLMRFESLWGFSQLAFLGMLSTDSSNLINFTEILTIFIASASVCLWYNGLNDVLDYEFDRHKLYKPLISGKISKLQVKLAIIFFTSLTLFCLYLCSACTTVYLTYFSIILAAILYNLFNKRVKSTILLIFLDIICAGPLAGMIYFGAHLHHDPFTFLPAISVIYTLALGPLMGYHNHCQDIKEDGKLGNTVPNALGAYEIENAKGKNLVKHSILSKSYVLSSELINTAFIIFFLLNIANTTFQISALFVLAISSFLTSVIFAFARLDKQQVEDFFYERLRLFMIPLYILTSSLSSQSNHLILWFTFLSPMFLCKYIFSDKWKFSMFFPTYSFLVEKFRFQRDAKHSSIG